MKKQFRHITFTLSFLPDISHTRGPLDGSLYAQVRKRRGPGTTSSAASPNGCLTRSPTVKSLIPTKPQLPTNNSNTSFSSIPSAHLNDPSPSIDCSEKENVDCQLKRGDGEDRAKEKTRGKERDRETAILDDRDPSSPMGVRREKSCCGQGTTKHGDAGWDRDREPCHSNGQCLGRCNSNKTHPKSQTLPVLPSKSVSPPPHSTHVELCHRHSAHPLPELPWERSPPLPSLPCLHRPCYPYSSPEHAHPRSHTLPASNRLCPGDDCHLFHYSSPGSHLPHHSQPSSPYREMFFSSLTPSSVCPCQDCSSRREHQVTSVRTFHQLHPDHSENPHWSQGAGVQQTREVLPPWETENPWAFTREAEFWQCKSAMPGLRLCHSSMDQVQNLEQPRFGIAPHQAFPIPQSLTDVRDGASSGYHTPLHPRHSCSCSPYQSSPAESHESRGYASGYHSGSASPLPSTPSPGRRKLPEIPTEHQIGKCKMMDYVHHCFSNK